MVLPFRRTTPRPTTRPGVGSASIAKQRLRAVVRKPQGHRDAMLLVRLLNEDLVAPAQRRAS